MKSCPSEGWPASHALGFLLSSCHTLYEAALGPSHELLLHPLLSHFIGFSRPPPGSSLASSGPNLPFVSPGYRKGGYALGFLVTNWDTCCILIKKLGHIVQGWHLAYALWPQVNFLYVNKRVTLRVTHYCPRVHHCPIP